MDAYGMSLLHNPAGHFRMPSHVLTDHEKGRLDIVLLQDIQHCRSIFRRGAVVKGQIHGLGIKIAVNPLRHACRQLILILRITDQLPLLTVGQKGGLDETGRHGCLPYHKKILTLAELSVPCLGLLQRSPVHQLRQSAGILPVAGIPGLDASRGSLPFLTGVLMNADKNIRPAVLRYSHSLLQGQPGLIVLSRKHRLIAHITKLTRQT